MIRPMPIPIAPVAHAGLSRVYPPVYRQQRAAPEESNPRPRPPNPAAAYDLLAGLSQAVLDDLALVRQSLLVASGGRLFNEGDPARGVYIVRTGRVKQIGMSPAGRIVVFGLQPAGAGAMLGLNAVVAGIRHAATAQAMTTTQVDLVPRDEFFAVAARHPELMRRVIQLLSTEVSEAWHQTRLLALPENREARLAQWLLHRAESKGMPAPNGILVPLSMTREEIGETLGMSRETVSRVFSDFMRRNAIRRATRNAVMVDAGQLEALGELV
jgi:CRP-like cAMP-binding protein